MGPLWRSQPFSHNSRLPCLFRQALKSAEQDLKKIKKRLEQFQKERQQSENFMRNMETQYMWIKDEKQYFGRPQTDYDFSSRDPAAAQSRLKQIKEEQASLSKKVRGFSREGLLRGGEMSGTCD